MNIKRSFFTFILLLLTISIQAQKATDTSITYIHQAAPSFSSRFIKIAARVFLPKKRISRKLAKDHYFDEAAPVPRKILNEFHIDITQINGRNVYWISPKEKKSVKYVLFLHGGAYINNIFRQHWNFAAKIVRETNCTFIIPDYPLAPSSNYTEAFTMLEALYKELFSKANAKDIILMGDSAGGGLALALAENQKNKGALQSDQIILLSPWLDITMLNPQIKEIQAKDVTLNSDNLVMAGKAWAGTAETDNYLLSPINGSLEGLPKISVFIGTHDILIADCRKLKLMLEQKDIPINYFEYPKMFHDWMMLISLKESKKAISQICSLISDKKL